MNATFIRIDRELVMRISNAGITIHDIPMSASAAALLISDGAAFLRDFIQKSEREKTQ